ncbi:hypothetical protein GCM10020367_31670 [Streptomyces sannanensis]|uniref:Uncharacterized protein n=1 Tax=Streptomyces sannanensis TaxID=285536 RepID=A0ABP6SDB7_9ACTN
MAGQGDDGEPALGGGEGVCEGQGGGVPVDGGHGSIFVRMFEKGKRKSLAENVPERFSSCGPWVWWVDGCLGWVSGDEEEVYPTFLMLARESGPPGWFTADSVGNSGVATSSPASGAVGQLPWNKPYL